MTGKKITKTLKKSGSSVKEIADILGVKSPTVSEVIHGHRPNPRIRKKIAEAIGVSIVDLWPKA